jgi:hypothetical protein
MQQAFLCIIWLKEVAVLIVILFEEILWKRIVELLDCLFIRESLFYHVVDLTVVCELGLLPVCLLIWLSCLLGLQHQV